MLALTLFKLKNSEFQSSDSDFNIFTSLTERVSWRAARQFYNPQTWIWSQKWIKLRWSTKETKTNQTPPRSRILLEKLTVTQLVKEFSAFYGTRKSITSFRKACNRGPVQHFVKRWFSQWRVSLSPNSQTRGSSLVGCPRLLIHYIRCYLSNVEAVSSARNVMNNSVVHKLLTLRTLPKTTVRFRYKNNFMNCSVILQE